MELGWCMGMAVARGNGVSFEFAWIDSFHLRGRRGRGRLKKKLGRSDAGVWGLFFSFASLVVGMRQGWVPD